MIRQKVNLSARKQIQIEKKIKEFEKKNPEISKALDIFDMSMQEYEKIVSSLTPIKTYTSSSTVAKSI